MGDQLDDQIAANWKQRVLRMPGDIINTVPKL